jgi:hypothetical protein
MSALRIVATVAVLTIVAVAVATIAAYFNGDIQIGDGDL